MGEKERAVLQRMIEGLARELKIIQDQVTEVLKKMPRVEKHVETETDWKREQEKKWELQVIHNDDMEKFRREVLIFTGKVLGGATVGTVALGIIVSLIIRAMSK